MAGPSALEIDQPEGRPLSLADSMIFVVAIALGLALARPAIGLIADGIRADPHWRFQTLAGAVGLGRMLNIVVVNFLMFLLPAVLIVRLRRPRPSLRSLVCQPGFVACACPVVVVLATMPLVLLPLSEFARDVIASAGQVLLIAAAPLAWAFLIVTGRWKGEPSWIDRLGRVLGVMGFMCTTAHFVMIRLPF